MVISVVHCTISRKLFDQFRGNMLCQDIDETFCIRFITAEIQICHDIVNIFYSLRIYTSIHVYGLIFNGKKRGGRLTKHEKSFQIIISA